MYVPLQENVNELAVGTSGWLVLVVSLLVTVGWLWHIYR